MADFWPYPPSDTVDVIFGPDRSFLDRLPWYKSCRSPPQSVQCRARSTTGIIYSSLSITPQQRKSQLVSPAHRLPAYSDSCLSPSLCVVQADFKLARQFPPEPYNTGTELEQKSCQYRSQISHWSQSKLYRWGKFLNTTLSFSIFYFRSYILIYIHHWLSMWMLSMYCEHSYNYNYYWPIPSLRNKHNNSWSVGWLFQTTSNRLYSW